MSGRAGEPRFSSFSMRSSAAGVQVDGNDRRKVLWKESDPQRSSATQVTLAASASVVGSVTLSISQIVEKQTQSTSAPQRRGECERSAEAAA